MNQRAPGWKEQEDMAGTRSRCTGQFCQLFLLTIGLTTGQRNIPLPQGNINGDDGSEKVQYATSP